MCGIFFACSRTEHTKPDSLTQNALHARGPDSLKYHYARTKPISCETPCPSETSDGWYLTFVSSVLSLRGNQTCVQPLVDPLTGSVLCWNGEAWKIDNVSVRENDTEQVFRLLLKAMPSSAAARPDLRDSRIMKLLTWISGPFAFVYFDAISSVLYYGRDRLGRRSLVISNPASSGTSFVISSLSFQKSDVTETTTDGVHCIDLNDPVPYCRTLTWPMNDISINAAVPPENHPDIPPIPSQEIVKDLTWHLLQAIHPRVADVPSYTTKENQFSGIPSKVAVLFSGGLDCTLLARLTHDILPLDQPIDLLNVAFENPRTVRAAMQGVRGGPKLSSSPVSPYESCPDRITARSSFAELVTTCPTRTWRLVTIDIPYTETLAHRSNIVSLMSPHNTEMDLSITLALYFASRGKGEAAISPERDSITTSYTTTARVLLSGLGADELFGGYTRHAAAFSRAGYTGLNTELQLDFDRIGSRNLGRDDRVLSHWGREIRYPYLDEDFVKFSLKLPIWEKTGFRAGKRIPKHFEGSSASGERHQEQSLGIDCEQDLDPAKLVLRMIAWRSGMRRAAAEKKRAIQFGARTAKMEGGKTKGTDLLAT